MGGADLCLPVSRQIHRCYGWGWTRQIGESPAMLKTFIAAGLHDDWHYHVRASQLVLVVFGTVCISFSEDDQIELSRSTVLASGDAFMIPPQLRHRIKGLADALLILACSPVYDESDHIVLELGHQLPKEPGRA